jgi:hypothetical protein
MLRAQPSSNPLRRSLSRIVTKWQRFVEIASDPHRPELYYMRGPGPKWHAKHGQRLAHGAL